MFTIGEFSKLSHVSPRMLRYYDAMGLIRPAQTGPENGYRSYDVSQLTNLAQIQTLKSYGFTLSEIRDLLPLSQEELAQRIHERRLKAYGELNELKKSLRRMEDRLSKLEGLQLAQENYSVIVMNTPPQRVFSIRKTINIAGIHDLFQELLREMESRGLKRAGATQLLYHGEEFSYESMDTEAQVQVSGNHPDVQEIPAQLCAAVTHIGPYETIHFAYDALCAWLGAHPKYRVCGAAIERYLKDEASVSSPEDLETGVLFPIEKVC